MPLGILALGLLAVPIASLRRGGRASGYAVSILSIVGYYALLRLGEGLGHDGIPAALAGRQPGQPRGRRPSPRRSSPLLARRGTGAVR